MIKKHIGVALVALGLLLSVGSIAAPAEAASLTSAQVQAVISLLQSFGVDASTIANVQSTLGGSSDTVSCSSFTDISYGNFDNNPGGRVSQLQTWLGISSNTFGFGTYGRKTQAAWNARCGGSQSTPPSNSINFTASPTSGSAPSSVNFSANGPINDFPFGIDFGDGSQGFVEGLHDCAGGCTPQSIDGFQTSHIYKNSGTYTATLTANAACYTIAPCPSKTMVGSETITITNGNSIQSSATIDQNSLTTNSPTPTITGTIANTSSICVVMLNAKAGSLLANYNSYSNKWSLCSDTHTPEGGSAAGITLLNGHWSMNTAFSRGTTFGNGNYNVGVYDESAGQLLTTGTLVVSGVSNQ